VPPGSVDRDLGGLPRLEAKAGRLLDREPPYVMRDRLDVQDPDRVRPGVPPFDL
jgi:hypothetical protein